MTIPRPAAATVATLAVAAPFLILLCLTLWRTPFPISEAVGLFEDTERQPASSFFVPDRAYYRPLFHAMLSALWHYSGSIPAALAAIKLLAHILPLTLLVTLFVVHLRPRTAVDAASAMLAVAILIGSPGLRGNLEIPLSYTIVGMPAALGVWMIAERRHRWWHGAAIVLLTLLAVGFKEQGLVIVPLVLVAWLTRAPGVGRGAVATVVGLALAYVVIRLTGSGTWSPFEQEVGFGFRALTTEEMEALGPFPVWIYAYNMAATAANVLFSEPTDGAFRIVAHLLQGETQPWEWLYLLSSVAVTTLIVWWGVGALRSATAGGWTPEARLFLALVVALAASGVLSFNYSRDRLGAMATIFYAAAAFHAVRGATARAAASTRGAALAVGIAAMLLSAAWQLRAVYTVEYTRQRAVNTHREWITDLQERRVEFASRPVYLRIMGEMIEQGTRPLGVRRTRYPRWVIRLLGES